MLVYIVSSNTYDRHSTFLLSNVNNYYFSEDVDAICTMRCPKSALFKHKKAYTAMLGAFLKQMHCGSILLILLILSNTVIPMNYCVCLPYQ